ncbi:MAG: DUF3822 family protein [Siphonobacter sp.]
MKSASLPTSVRSLTLTLGLGTNAIQIGVTDTGNCLFLEEYPLNDPTTDEEYLSEIQLLFAEHELLQRTLWNAIRIIINNQSFTLVPETLFRKEFAVNCLSLARGQSVDNEAIFVTPHAQWQAFTVFSFPKNVSDWLLETYPFENLIIRHQTDLLLGLNLPERCLAIYVANNTATILFTDQAALRYCNRFVFRTSLDVIYYILFVLNELQINTAKESVWLFGDVSPDLQQGLQKYLAHLHIGVPDSVHVSELADFPISPLAGVLVGL